MALEPQLESPEPYALNHQPPRSFYSSLTQEERARLCCAKARLAFSMTSCTTKCSAQCTVLPTSITWQSLKVRGPVPRTARRKSSRPARPACVRGPLVAESCVTGRSLNFPPGWRHLLCSDLAVRLLFKATKTLLASLALLLPKFISPGRISRLGPDQGFCQHFCKSLTKVVEGRSKGASTGLGLGGHTHTLGLAGKFLMGLKVEIGR